MLCQKDITTPVKNMAIEVHWVDVHVFMSCFTGVLKNNHQVDQGTRFEVASIDLV